MCRHFYLTCVEIRFCCKLQQFCCSCNSTLSSNSKMFSPYCASNSPALNLSPAFQDTCYEPYSNRCCDNDPCANDAKCTETGDRGKPGFNCTCANEYNTGPLCKREINSCFDYLWNDKTVKSGMEAIHAVSELHLTAEINLPLLVKVIGASVTQSSEPATFTSEFLGPSLATDSSEKSRSTLCPV
jgi:hypothetical protein